MSRKEKLTTQENPAVRTLTWKSDKATMVYYDKELKENVEINLPFKFAVLEKDYVSFNGYSESLNEGIWSNEVKNKEDVVTVKAGKNILKQFKKEEWKDVKDDPDLKGCNYTQILYIAAQLDGDDEEKIYRIMLNKASFGGGITTDKKTGKEHEGQENDGWIRFINKLSKGKPNAIYDNYILITGSKTKKNGAVTYTLAEFDSEPIPESQIEKYDEMTSVVEEYFEYYNNKPKEDIAVEEHVMQDDTDL